MLRRPLVGALLIGMGTHEGCPDTGFWWEFFLWLLRAKRAPTRGAPTLDFGGSFSFGYCVLKGHPRGVPRRRILDCDFPSPFVLSPSSLKKKSPPGEPRGLYYFEELIGSSARITC